MTTLGRSPRLGEGELPRKGRRPKPTRRDWGASWGNVFYVADDETHQTICELIADARRRYGHTEAQQELRAACQETRRGKCILAQLAAKFPNSDPRAPESEDEGNVDVSELLNDFFNWSALQAELDRLTRMADEQGWPRHIREQKLAAARERFSEPADQRTTMYPSSPGRESRDP